MVKLKERPASICPPGNPNLKRQKGVVEGGRGENEKSMGGGDRRGEPTSLEKHGRGECTITGEEGNLHGGAERKQVKS